MKLGDRIKTKAFGEGTVVGFEKFTSAGNSYISSTPSARARVLVALDNPKAWILASSKQPHPYMMGSDFLPEMAEPRTPRIQPLAPTPLPLIGNCIETRMERYLTTLRWRLASVIVIATIGLWVTR